jgi:hypothetical protein
MPSAAMTTSASVAPAANETRAASGFAKKLFVGLASTYECLLYNARAFRHGFAFTLRTTVRRSCVGPIIFH